MQEEVSKGVFLVTTKNAFPPVKRDNSVSTYYQDFQLSHEGVSKVSERARERSERSEASIAKRSAAKRASGASEPT